MVLCGKCHSRHERPADVKACYERARSQPEGQTARPQPKKQRAGSTEWRQRHTVPTTFDLEEPAVVYLMAHDGLGSLKIGVTGRGRIEEHNAYGWELVQAWSFTSGYDALEVEGSVLDRWRNLFSQRPSVRHIQMQQGGASETATDSDDTRSDTCDFVNHLHHQLAEQPVLAYDLDPYEDDPWAASDWADDWR